MPEFEGIGEHRGASYWPHLTIAVGCLLLIMWLKVTGVLLSVCILALVFFILRFRPDSNEVATLKSSVRLSLEDIEDVVRAFQKFEVGQDAESLADRTLHRPALLDLDTDSEEIAKFHFLLGNSKRFSRRVEGKLRQNLSVSQLERLLTVTDTRASELQQAWLEARKAAYRLGPSNNS
ncbi:hypothetical protein NQ015_00775 [Corynebacterium sp. 153RC1]|uniref:hypothetical protein n=1 Tax=unclassified Corynebacterium TaxID=2624378 RepID=UPI00211C43EE|nr:MULTISPECIES: hypothetical protein [unclassified Corynebacterium]MCQ9370751.1 hypothetical protein [Corynebacterium sp. 35RC1]MCQ9351560.1 hypothetical protein [Corynebacterium sp. 209RC1]MCQ9353929.1 hypothetical protein [Corynebacterium sp. 1222RC1]MCQ9355843.1 hypothetical protein [Corynebacterium sp. 122RC1]MCQ9358087.1 hypothetical protein [Corynebacterium sp. 142RC1]